MKNFGRGGIRLIPGPTVVKDVEQLDELGAGLGVPNLVGMLTQEPACTCGHSLADAIITQPDRIPPKTRQKLALLVDKYLPN